MADLIDYELAGIDDVRAIAQLGAAAARPEEVGEVHGDTRYIVEDGAGGKTLLTVPGLPLHPDRTDAKRTVTNDDAFIAYVNRHGSAHTEIWADQKNNRVIGIIDANDEVGIQGDRFGWERHRVMLSLEHTPGWTAWVNGQGLKTQAAFAEHVEEYAENVFVPSGGELLEIAQTLQGTRNADFRSGTRLSTGEAQFQYVEEIKGQAGKSGNLTIPEEFELGLAPYLGGAAYKVVAKLRWRLEAGHVQIGYKLIGIDRILEEAFKEIVGHITEGVEFPVFNGRP
ncbi:YfdQ family protein [Leucobacter allii]|uniref:DUF2303 family protein n=1 Tax=Leucobacter allii TaxID=2932247 RepID=UPI001FD2D23E|nr:DUF2303 family protein [Leucobacter allii]UOR02013.1 YfdQ family protein [Leucobacter allii]